MKETEFVAQTMRSDIIMMAVIEMTFERTFFFVTYMFVIIICDLSKLYKLYTAQVEAENVYTNCCQVQKTC